MKYVLMTIACLAALSVSGCAMESEPEPANEESPDEPRVGSAEEALCNGIVVCVNHLLWCEPRTPAGKASVVGGC